MANPRQPYPVYGTVKDSDGNAVSNLIVTITDITVDDSVTFTTTSDGKYLVDLANMYSAYSIGDSIAVRANMISNKFANIDSTQTTGTVGTSASNIDVTYTALTLTYTSLREDIWDLFKYLMGTSFTYKIDTTMVDSYGADVIPIIYIHADYNDAKIKLEKYPQITLYRSKSKTKALDFKKELGNKEINVMIEVTHTNTEKLKLLTDNIEKNIELAEKNGAFDILGLHNMEIEDDYDFWSETDKKVHRTTFNINFMYLGSR